MIKISIDSIVLNITHCDLDGCGCAIVLGNIFKNITHQFVSFYNIDKVLQNINYDNYDYVIITDIFPSDAQYLNNDKIILFDHHPSPFKDFNKHRYVITQKGCASVIVKYYFENIYNIDLSYLNEFIKYVNDYDLWNLKYKESKILNDLLFNKYSFKYHDFVNDFKLGRVKFFNDELKFIDDLNKKFFNIYNNIDVIELDSINACVVNEGQFINDIADKLLKEQNYAIVFMYSKNRCSIRVNINHEIDIGKILKTLNIGGGHEKSAGMICDNYDDFLLKLDILEKYLYLNYNIKKK